MKHTSEMRNTTATMRSIIRSIEKLIIFVATGEQYTLNFASYEHQKVENREKTLQKQAV